MKRYAMDACALQAVLRGEKGSDIVENLIKAALQMDVCIFMHKLNLLEVYYDIFREFGIFEAQKVLRWVQRLPIEVIPEISDEILWRRGG